VALFPDTKSAVVVLTNPIPVSDAADWIARKVIQALFGLNDGQDYVALAKEANRRTLAQCDDLAGKITSMRMACPGSRPPEIKSFIGRYALQSKLFFIYVLPHSEKSDRLSIQFQGFKS